MNLETSSASLQTNISLQTIPIWEIAGNRIPSDKKKEHSRNRKKQANNGKRCLGMAMKARQNLRNFKDLETYLKQEMDEKRMEYLMRYRKALLCCCKYSAFREHYHDGTLEFMGAHTCGHKLCMVCNAEKAKIIRRKYYMFFERNPEVLEQYDFMHLTLTVPHDEKGFRGKIWYGDELKREFNFMRKKKWWKELVYAGEFGLEMTKNQKGLHIHIHSLVLVHKTKQNRNILHKKILMGWNKQTAGSGHRTEFTEKEKKAILKSNRLLSKKDLEKMRPDGATLIGLESLYIRTSKGSKLYVSPKKGIDKMMGGIMECIKYHFEPLAMYKDGILNFDLILEIMPGIKGKALHVKYGAFHSATKNAHADAKLLSASSKLSDFDEIEEILEETAGESVTHPKTGEKVLREEYGYFVTSIRRAYVRQDKEFEIKVSPDVRSYVEGNLSSVLKNMALSAASLAVAN